MFQTEFIFYLQHHLHHCFTTPIIQITNWGTTDFLIPIIFVAIFGIDFKKDFLLFHLFLWTSLVTNTLKVLVASPKSDYVDHDVTNLEAAIKNTSLFSGNGNKGIFSLPDEKIPTNLTIFRLHKLVNLIVLLLDLVVMVLIQGMCRTTALWGGIATVFNSRIIRILTPIVIVLIAFSRVYLEKHFIEDVVGGDIVGLISIVVFAYVLKSSLIHDFFKK